MTVPTVDLDAFAQTIWPSPNDLTIMQNCTVLIGGSMTAQPGHSLPPMADVANLAVRNGKPAPTGPWGQSTEVPSILDELRTTMSR